MRSLLICVLASLWVHHAVCYWDPDRKLVEDPEYSNPNCDNYCRRMPDYMNWREDMDYRERQGIDRVIRDTRWGSVEGMSVPGVHDTSSFVSIFLGIPYAEQITQSKKSELRFKVCLHQILYIKLNVIYWLELSIVQPFHWFTMVEAPSIFCANFRVYYSPGTAAIDDKSVQVKMIQP